MPKFVVAMNKPLVIGNVYRPPRELIEPLTCFIEEFNISINHDKVKGKKIILTGDFNINLLKISEKIKNANFFDMLTANSLLPNITCSTRITQTSATLIDNIFLNSLRDIVFSGIIANKSISDHQIIQWWQKESGPSAILSKKEQTRVKRPNKSRKIVNFYLKYNMYK